MAAILNLTAVPGHLERGRGYTIKVVEILGRELARTAKPIATVADAREAVQAFGKTLREREPDSSFAVLVGVRRGDRKPRGFDAAHAGNGFGQDDFLHVKGEQPAPVTALATAAGAASLAASLPPAAE